MRKWSPSDCSRILARINASENNLSDIFASHVKREDRLLDESLLHHQFKQWRHAIHRNGLESHSYQSVETSRYERQSGLRSHLRKCMLRHVRTSNLNAILRQETCSCSRTVLDREGAAVLHVSRGLRVVVLVVEQASQLVPWAKRAWNLLVEIQTHQNIPKT